MNGINKRLQMLHVGIGINAMTKVCYVALSTKLQQHFFGQFWYVFLSKNRINEDTINSILSVPLPSN